MPSTKSSVDPQVERRQLIAALFDPTSPRQAERFQRDLLGEVVLAVAGEPAYANVTGLAEEQAETRTIIGLPNYPFAVGVDWDGTLNRAGYGYYDTRRTEDIGPLDILYFQVGVPPRKIRDLGWKATSRSLHQGLPILTTRALYQRLIYAIECFACSRDMSSDADLSLMLDVYVRNPGRQPAPYAVELRAKQLGGKRLRRVAGRLAGQQECHYYFRIHYRNSRKPRFAEYPPIRKIQTYAIHDIKTSVARITPQAYAANRKACAAFWNQLLAEGMTINVPERRVQDAFRAWQCYGFLNVRKLNWNGKKVVCEPHDGSAYYSAVFGISACSYVHALLLTGQFAEARRCLEALVNYQDQQGLFVVNYGLCDLGALLFVIGQYYLFTGDRRGLRILWPQAVKGADWICGHRNLSAAAKNTMVYGLLPPMKYACDMREKDICYLADVYAWLGLQSLAQAGAAAGLRRAARVLRKEAEAYRRDIRASMRRAVFPENELFQADEYSETSYAWTVRGILAGGRLPVLPMTPMTRYLEKRFAGGYYYASLALQMLETGFFEPGDPLAQTVVRFIEQRGGLILGNLQWAGHTGLDHAYSYGYLLTQMRKNDVGRVLLGFYTMLAHGMSRDTYAGGECRTLLSGIGNYNAGGAADYTAGVPQFRLRGGSHCQPHNYSNVQQIRTLRMMLVREEGDQLILGASAPRPWLTSLEVRNAGTAWGAVDFSARVSGARAEVRYQCRPIRSAGPKAVHVCIRHPERRRMLSVQVNGQSWSQWTAESETIRLRPDLLEAIIIVQYETTSLIQ